MLYLAIETEVATKVVAYLILDRKIQAIKILRDSETALVESTYEGDGTRMLYRPSLREAKDMVDRMLDNLHRAPLYSGIDFRITEARFHVKLTP